VRGEASAEPLGAGESDIVDFETVTIEQLNTGEPKHAGELVLMSAFVIVIAKNGNDGNADVFEDIEAGAHLVGHAVVCKIAGDYECICELVDQGKLADVPLPVICREMNVSDSGNSHSLPLVAPSVGNGCG
jgi:hypothetical protein